MIEKVLIFPEPGMTKLIARKLLDLTDNPTEVEFVLWPQEGFRVPEELALKFEADFNPVKDFEGPVEATEVEEPVKRKPGRPKKEAQ